MRPLLIVLLLLLLATHAGAEPPWSHERPQVRRRVLQGEPIVIHVVIPLCDNRLIYCGANGLGNPLSPRSNLYWGAMFGPLRFFEREGRGYERLPQPATPEGVLERRVYRRRVDGRAWGLAVGRRAEAIVVLDAIEGGRIDDAVSRFWRAATRGATLSLHDGGRIRRLAVAAVGYAGHNRLMDGKRLPAPEPSDAALPSFVMACKSEGYFGAPLRRAGSRPLVMTRSLMAPEGYVVEALVSGLAENLPRSSLRRRVVRAYASWQGISERRAGRIFAE